MTNLTLASYDMLGFEQLERVMGNVRQRPETKAITFNIEKLPIIVIVITLAVAGFANRICR